MENRQNSMPCRFRLPLSWEVKIMTEWYSYTPQDTLYFRGAEPAVMGESHSASMIFPPPAQTIAGAIRTAALVQNGIPFVDYKVGKTGVDKSAIIDAIGKSGEDSPFGVFGPFFERYGKVWLPCPYNWFSEKDDNKNPESRKRKIIVSAPVKKNDLIKTASSERIFWARGNNLETMGGLWVCSEELCAPSIEKTILNSGDFFVRENHMGIALDVKGTRRTAREGHLYSFAHARLQDNVKLVFGVTEQLPLQAKGVLKLGAEQRFGEYRKIGDIGWPQGKSGLFMTLSLMPGGEEANCHCVATGKISYLGGWNMHHGFHKPMKGYFPAGSVFNKQINDNCIEL
jgi:CRISPR-associated protein Cmr3